MVNSRYYIIISPECSYCTKTIELLVEKRKSFVVTVYEFGDKLLDEAKAYWGHPTVPIVCRGQELLGGFSELMEHFNGTTQDQKNEEQEKNSS